jgi:hypothetical protein
MPTPTLGEAVRQLAEATARGVERGRIVSIGESTAIVQHGRDATLAVPTTDEVLRAGDNVWVQPSGKARGSRLVIHGKD